MGYANFKRSYRRTGTILKGEQKPLWPPAHRKSAGTMRVPDSRFILGLKFYRQIFTLSTATLNRLINSHLQNNRLIEARKLFDQNPTSADTGTWNIIIKAYVEQDHIDLARKLFDKMPDKDRLSWQTMLSGLSMTKDPLAVYHYFLHMQRSGLKPTEDTICSLIGAALESVLKVLIPQVHALAISLGLNGSAYSGSWLMKGYTSIKDQTSLGRVFDDISVKDVAEWNNLISCDMKLGCLVESQSAFDRMPEKNIHSWMTMVVGYITNRRVNRARLVFDQMSEKDVICWTAMINGYVRNGMYLDALKLFQKMMASGIRPNHYTFSSILGACAGSCSLITGKQMHSSLIKQGTRSNIILSTSLMNMYAKSGEIDAASCVFDSMPRKSVEAWDSMIGGYARHGMGFHALQQFDRMMEGGFKPDQVTYINLLSACAHAGLVVEGEKHFSSMRNNAIRASKEHYACMVDMYGKTGQLEKAEKLIKGMPFEADVVIWGALLGGCGLHSCLELGRFDAEGLSKLKHDHPAASSILTKLYGEQGVWNDVVTSRRMAKREKIQKQIAES